VTDPTATQTWKLGQAVDLALAANTFTDPQGEAMTYTATQSNGAALPSWLHFNGATDTFTGTVPNTATGLNIKVTATDTGGASASETLAVLTPAPAAPTDEAFGDLAVDRSEQVVSLCVRFWLASQGEAHSRRRGTSRMR
jgi:hypothetical protein